MTSHDHAHLPYKAADVIDGIPADNIGGFIPGQCLFAQGHSEIAVAAVAGDAGVAEATRREKGRREKGTSLMRLNEVPLFLFE
jgi:hypothetical protein